MPRDPKATRREPKGSPRAPKGVPRAPKRCPKRHPKRHPEWVQVPIHNPGPYLSQKTYLDRAGSIQMTSEKTCLSNGTGSAFCCLETFQRVGAHVPKQSRTPHSCAWPTYPPIYLYIHLSGTLAKQAKTAYSQPKVYENTPQGPPK